MKCIYCNCTESRVVDSRPTEDGAIRRRRECEECKRRFTTYEKIEMLPVLVVKKDKRREQFDAAKVRSGIIKGVRKAAGTAGGDRKAGAAGGDQRLPAAGEKR